MIAWSIWLPSNSVVMCLDQRPKLAVRKHWASASTCAGSGVLPVVLSRTSPCYPIPCFTPFLWKLVLILLYSHQWESYPFLLVPPWKEVCPHAGPCLGVTSVKQQGSDGQFPPAVVWCHVRNMKTVTSAWTAKPQTINCGGAYAGATAA